MADEVNRQAGGELPLAQGDYVQPAAAPNIPNANLRLATATPQTEVVQEAVAVLMSTELSPYQMATQFAQIKERYLAKTYGITIE